MAQIWVLSDGKPGHLNQSLGLAEALLRLRPELSYKQLDVSAGWRLLFEAQKPELIISAGRRTHHWNWLCSLRYGARNIVLMRPSFPRSCFDLVLAPEHDKMGGDDPRLVETRGALNRMRPAAKVAGSSLLLVGGPSKHVVWDDTQVINQIQTILDTNDGLKLAIATSRRTPVEFVERIRALERIELILPESVDSSWLPTTLGVTERVWVTADSVSMVFEALTAGCAVSLIGLESIPNSRTQRGMQMLLDAGLVDFRTDVALSVSGASLSEAERCAQLILEKEWL